MERAVARGRRPRVGNHRRAGHIVVLARQQVRLEVQDAAGRLGVSGDEGQTVLLDQRQGDRRLKRAQHDAVRAGQPERLRQLGTHGKSGLGIRRRATVLQKVPRPTESVPGQKHEVSRHWRIPDRTGLAVEHALRYVSKP